MPSDIRIQQALTALAAPRERFRSAIAAAHDQMASYLASHRTRTISRAQAATKTLGEFAAGRIDPERFGALFSDTHALTPETTERIERLVGVLAELLAEGDAVFTCDVPSGGNLRSFVHGALAQAGRAFGAVLAYQALKAGIHGERHEADALVFPFSKWNRSERLLGFLLVVSVDGADLRAEDLVDFIDGRMCFVLVVRGVSSPAPLVRLITPGVFVIQATDVDDLTRLGALEGPAIAALVPQGTGRFAHVPGGGLTVSHVPTDVPKTSLGSRSAWQQREELLRLTELARVKPPESDSAVDVLASWLVSQAREESAK
jgi:hypothetical protein